MVIAFSGPSSAGFVSSWAQLTGQMWWMTICAAWCCSGKIGRLICGGQPFLWSWQLAFVTYLHWGACLTDWWSVSCLAILDQLFLAIFVFSLLGHGLWDWLFQSSLLHWWWWCSEGVIAGWKWIAWSRDRILAWLTSQQLMDGSCLQDLLRPEGARGSSNRSLWWCTSDASGFREV